MKNKKLFRISDFTFPPIETHLGVSLFVIPSEVEESLVSPIIGKWKGFLHALRLVGMTKGFSLIELLFAMSFLTVIILGVVSLQTSNLAMMGGNNNRIQAHFLANQGAQIVKGVGYNAIQTACTATLPSASPCIKYINSSGYKIDDTSETINTLFNRSVEIDQTGLTNSYKVTVIVEWTDSTGEHLKKDNAHAEAKLIVSKP